MHILNHSISIYCFSDYMHVIRLFSKQTPIWLIKVQTVVCLLNVQRRITGRAKKIQAFLHQQVATLNRRGKKEGSGLREIYFPCIVKISKEEKRSGRNLTLFPAMMNTLHVQGLYMRAQEDSIRTSQRFLGQTEKSSLGLFNTLGGNKPPRARRQLPVVHASTPPKGSEYWPSIHVFMV